MKKLFNQFCLVMIIIFAFSYIIYGGLIVLDNMDIKMPISEFLKPIFACAFPGLFFYIAFEKTKD